MTDAEKREKVIRGLAACNRQSYNGSDCQSCPYYDDEDTAELPFGICNIQDMFDDTLALLKEQEPRVLTLEEVLNADDFVWAEIYTPKKWSWCVVYAKISPLVGNDEIVLIEEDCGTGWTRNKAEYGKRGFLNGGWRCWTSRPTEEQMRDTKWEGDNDAE